MNWGGIRPLQIYETQYIRALKLVPLERFSLSYFKIWILRIKLMKYIGSSVYMYI